MPYMDRLKHLNLPTLESRRHIADLVTVYKLLRGHLDVNAADLDVVCSSTRTRGCGVNLVVPRAINNTVHHVFGYRISRLWNDLPLSVKLAPSVAAFRHKLLARLNV